MFKCNVCGKEYNILGYMKEIRVTISGSSFFTRETSIMLHVCESCFLNKKMSRRDVVSMDLFFENMSNSVGNGILELIFPSDTKQVEKVDKLSFLDDE